MQDYTGTQFRTVSTCLESIAPREANSRGIIGLVNGYIGTVEAQGRGTLHLHILFWLAGSPTSELMQASLQSESFQAKILAYIKKTIRADIKAHDGPTVVALTKTPSVAYSRPPDPCKPHYKL
ncbi:hypothetical protein DFH07DRAFT_782499 [Mycena maculata]|uniref:Helitron helicase-like domain-containing protein n=1 Tax=Mycena maculata TaxID=230809 RepID=A0AAD7MPR8_9AGAR|nr:hypothetical protein DFH07DRAFT_782499 [Mycena maculata]